MLLILATMPGTTIAQTHGGHGTHATSSTATESAATKAFRAANAKMHKDMDITFSGNVDSDFVRGMIPHHQGAVEMAKIMLAHGTDPELRKLAEGIIADQEKEIALMTAWLKKNGK
jgi:uncharacterized protein (DUF305 family)